MTKMQKLKTILQRLHDGERLACMGSKGACEMYLTWDAYAQHHVIHYHSFGSSAIRATLSNLRWLFDVIFKCADYEVMTPDELKEKTGHDYFYLF